MPKKTEYIIKRKDLFPTQKDLEKLLKEYEEKGLSVEKEVAKLMKLGYIQLVESKTEIKIKKVQEDV